MRISFNYDYLHADAVGEIGITARELSELKTSHPQPLSQLTQNPHGMPLGWLNLEARLAEVADVNEALARFATASALVAIGMGGSALGTRAVAATYARQTGASAFSANGRTLIVLDNLDEATTAEIAERLQGESIVLNPVSKSGNTLETIANFLALSTRSGLNILGTVATTGNEAGALAEHARECGLSALPVPEDVGGRFSVLSPVGLFPLAFLGYPIERLLDGARSALQELTSDDYDGNPALALAARLYLLAHERGMGQLLLWAYCDALREWGQWWVQLFAESLGKQRLDEGKTVGVGITPIAVTGPSAQHSILQLALDGPRDKTCGFIGIAEPKSRLPAFRDFPKGMEGFSYLRDRRIHEVVAAELEGTRESLSLRGCPNFSLELPSLEPEVMGELILLFEVAVALMGVFLGVNPFDQPAVEESKRLAREQLQRRGG